MMRSSINSVRKNQFSCQSVSINSISLASQIDQFSQSCSISLTSQTDPKVLMWGAIGLANVGCRRARFDASLVQRSVALFGLVLALCTARFYGSSVQCSVALFVLILALCTARSDLRPIISEMDAPTPSSTRSTPTAVPWSILSRTHLLPSDSAVISY